MIKKIALSLIIICLFIALPLAIIGVKKVDIGPSFYWFMGQVSRDFTSWKLTIPSIPTVAPLEETSGWIIVINFLMNVFNALIVFLNVIITLFNYIIQLLQFILTLVFDLGKLVGYLISTGDYSYDWPIV